MTGTGYQHQVRIQFSDLDLESGNALGQPAFSACEIRFGCQVLVATFYPRNPLLYRRHVSFLRA